MPKDQEQYPHRSGRQTLFLLRKRSKAGPTESGGGSGGVKENQVSLKLQLTSPGLIPENRHKSKFQKEPKILPEIPPEIICSKVTLGQKTEKVTLSQKSEELSPASALSGQTVWRPGNSTGPQQTPQGQANRPGSQ